MDRVTLTINISALAFSLIAILTSTTTALRQSRHAEHANVLSVMSEVFEKFRLWTLSTIWTMYQRSCGSNFLRKRLGSTSYPGRRGIMRGQSPPSSPWSGHWYPTEWSVT
jgi:hypothetical protein